MVINFNQKEPKIHKQAYVVSNADIIGDVILGKNSSIWFGAVLRGDVNKIIIGEGSNIQDNCTIHVNEEDNPVVIGDGVTIGHNAVIHGCKVGDNCIIGIGSIIMDNVEIGEETIIGAGTLISPGEKVPSGVLCVGSPSRVERKLTQEEKESIRKSADYYVKVSSKYKNIR